MAEGMSFSFPSLLFHEGRTYGQPEVVPISLPQVSTGMQKIIPSVNPPKICISEEWSEAGVRQLIAMSVS